MAGMPPPSDKTAWDFLPDGWITRTWAPEVCKDISPAEAYRNRQFEQADGVTRYVAFPKGFQPVTQLEHARLGIITPEMYRVATREPHLTAA